VQPPAPTKQTDNPEVNSGAEVAVKAPIETNTAVQPKRENLQSGQVATPKPSPDKARTENEEANRTKPAVDQTPSVINAPEPVTPVNDATALAEALKAAEAKAAEEKAAAARSDAAVQAFLQAQEAGRQAKAARDAKEQKEADERARANRQNASRTFSNSLFWIK
jgi:hypothetical protein